MSKKLPVIAIVGRPNVGKSSLLNRIIGKREAIVHGSPGVTRDRNNHIAHWTGVSFEIIDTGGIFTSMVKKEQTDFQDDIEEQVDIAISHSDVILFLTDGKEGINPIEEAISKKLRQHKQKVILVVNKIDSQLAQSNLYEFSTLGFEDAYPVSALKGTGVGDLLDQALKHFPKSDSKLVKVDAPENIIQVAIVGRPNVGKSSLLNVVVNADRALVSPISGTTRDSINEIVKVNKQTYCFIDTAGIRKKAKVTDDVEYYSVLRAMKALEKADIGILIIDATQMVEMQDQKIAGLIEKHGKGCLILINKWDLIEKNSTTILKYTENIRTLLKFIKYAPILFISATQKQRTFDIYQELNQINKFYHLRIPTAELNLFIRHTIKTTPPKSVHGKLLKIYYGTQPETAPPLFLFFCK